MFFTVKVEKLIFGGYGLARLPNNKVVLIPYTIPDEVLQIKIIKDFGDYAEGEIEKIIEPSPYRRKPVCNYFGICGGCQLQHITYSYQLKLKENIFFDTFRRLGWKEDIPLEKVIPSPKEFFYRNRLRFHIESTPLKLGFIKRKTHEIVKIEKCFLGEEILNDVLAQLYNNIFWIKICFQSKRLKIEFSPVENKATLIFWTSSHPSKEDIEGLFSIEKLKAVFYCLKGKPPYGPFPKDSPFEGRRIFKNIDNIYYYVQPGVFVQANWDINCAIMKTIKSLNLSFERVLDLHTSMGNFLFPLLEKGKEFLGVDTDIRAIKDGLYTAKKAGINANLKLENISATKVLYEAIKIRKKFDLVILDPPRGGCKELIKFLPEVANKYIIYISCDLPTLVRDLLILKDLNYKVTKLFLFDMFPQTYHFETLALLEKK